LLVFGGKNRRWGVLGVVVVGVVGDADNGDNAAFLGIVVVVIAGALAGGRHAAESLAEGGQTGGHGGSK